MNHDIGDSIYIRMHIIYKNPKNRHFHKEWQLRSQYPSLVFY